MNRIIKKSFTLIFIIAILLTTFSVSYVDAEESNEIVSVTKEITISDSLEININVSNINYDSFKVLLKSNISLNNIKAVDNLDNNIDTTLNNDELSFNIDKTKTNITNILLKYNLPDTVAVNDNVVINVEIINSLNEEDKISIDKTITIKAKEIIPEVIEEIPNTENKQEEIKEEIKTDIKENTNTIKTQVINKTPSTNVTNTNIQSNMSSVSASTSNVVKVTYNGSDNNYLKSLSVSGYTLNKDFTKENTTYFITVDNTVKKLSVSAKAEDSDSVVKINGNKELSEGLNKILITIYAENGNTRTYRIYVTKEA